MELIEREGANLDLEKVLRWPVDLLKGLMARVWDGLHFGFAECFRSRLMGNWL